MSEPRLCVPVKVGAYASALRLFRTASGKRTAVAFSSPLKLAKVLGTEQRWVLLTAPALRGMLAELDVTGIVVDPAGTMSGPAERAPAGPARQVA
ncbi:SAV_915 family protein [Nonomuraea jiangxiensis]|uniref:SseB protein N-terminal domain-containing protein n=1 Tax=Nonomuraea jiangxiensis TaxID=633440 RepID=A0A1G8DH51_9ACTN|nr:SAV_915 family protein [Nonomuraea jiangxiensis]SDH57006.1 SseB protein N-terminal domain-containing protein [Nonomuraea jiangxiensis]